MHPGMLHWLRRRHHGRDECGTWAGCGPSGDGERGSWGASHDSEGGHFGVRRPLRFLAYKLDLEEEQVAELAKVLNELKTERAQAEVDQRRTVASFADAISSEAFDEAKATDGAKLRSESNERLRKAVLDALKRIHALLTPEQRERFAYLIRTGVVSL